jgi:hypothetical protein
MAEKFETSTLKRCASEEASSACKRYRKDTTEVFHEHLSATHYNPHVSDKEFEALLDVLLSNNFAFQMPVVAAPVDDEPVDDEPVDDEPVDDEPVDDEPVDDDFDAESEPDFYSDVDVESDPDFDFDALDADLEMAGLAGIPELAGLPAGLLDELNDDAKFDNLEDDEDDEDDEDEDNLEDADATADADTTYDVDMYFDELFATIKFDPDFDIETAVAELLA